APGLVPAGDDLGTFLAAGVDIAGDAAELLVRDQRSHVGRWIETGPDLDLLSDRRDAGDDLVEHALVRVEPRAGAAALAVVEEDRARRARDRLLEVRVGENDRWRLATELEAHFLEVARCCLDDQLADLGRAGERDLVDLLVRRERGTRGL